jgi:hypothetical protein
MHGMLSLWVLVAAFAGLAGWAGYVSVRLYRTCPAGQAPPAQPDTGPATAAGPVSAGIDPTNAGANRTGLAGCSSRADRTGRADHTGLAGHTGPVDHAELAANQTTSPHPVA